jgi:hypothetical protein
LLPVKNHIFHILSHCAAKTEIMVLGKETLEESQKTGVPNQLDGYWFKVAQRAGNRGGFMWDVGNRDLAAASTGSSSPRQGNMAALV